MWPLVREGLRAYRAALFIAWASTVVGIAAVFATLAAFGVLDARRGLLWGATSLPVYLLIASSVAGWIAFGQEMSEHRLRLHILLPLSARQVGLARHLLPAALLAPGLPLALAVAVVVRPAPGVPSGWLRYDLLLLLFFHLLCLQQIAFAIKEVTVLRGQGWGKVFPALLVLLVPILAQLLLGLPVDSVVLRIAIVAGTAVVTGAWTLALFERRSDLAG